MLHLFGKKEKRLSHETNYNFLDFSQLFLYIKSNDYICEVFYG